MINTTKIKENILQTYKDEDNIIINSYGCFNVTHYGLITKYLESIAESVLYYKYYNNV